MESIVCKRSIRDQLIAGVMDGKHESPNKPRADGEILIGITKAPLIEQMPGIWGPVSVSVSYVNLCLARQSTLHRELTGGDGDSVRRPQKSSLLAERNGRYAKRRRDSGNWSRESSDGLKQAAFVHKHWVFL